MRLSLLYVETQPCCSPLAQAQLKKSHPLLQYSPHTAWGLQWPPHIVSWPDPIALQTESTFLNFRETSCSHPCGSLRLSPRKQGLTSSAVKRKHRLYYVKPPLYKRRNPTVVQKIPTLSNRCFLPLGHLVISDSVSCSLYFNDGKAGQEQTAARLLMANYQPHHEVWVLGGWYTKQRRCHRRSHWDCFKPGPGPQS